MPHYPTGHEPPETANRRIIKAGKMSDWALLPDILLDGVFSQLALKYRYYASLVCRTWNDAFYSPHVWRHLEVDHESFTYNQYIMYHGYQLHLSHRRIQGYLSMFGHCIRLLIIHPNSSFHNLCGFLRVIGSFLQFHDDYPMANWTDFRFYFFCETRLKWGGRVIGTGGQVLERIRTLLDNIKGLKRLTLNQLLLDNKDSLDLLERFQTHNRESLVYLELMNCTKSPHPMFHVSMFPNLVKLVISPAQINDDLLLMIAENTLVDELVLAQDKFTPSETEAISAQAWWGVMQIKPRMMVRLEVRDTTEKEVLLQENAPVEEVIYSNPHAMVVPRTIIQITDLYQSQLRVYGHKGIPRKFGSRSFHERGDSNLVFFVRQCPYLHTLLINQRVSTATLLLLATEGKSIRNLYVRRNSVLLKRDWPKSPEWSDDFYEWLRDTSRSYEKTEKEISKLLDKRWFMLSDKQYMKLSI